MSVINTKIIDKKIVHCNFQVPTDLSSGVSFSVTIEAKLRRSKNDEKLARLDVTFDGATSNNDNFKIFIEAFFLIEFDGFTENADEIAEACAPEACRIICDDVDKILLVLGHKPLHLSESQSIEDNSL